MTAPAQHVRYFHGGIPDLNRGDLIKPHPPRIVDGCPICVARAAGKNLTVPGLGVVDPATKHPDRVYVSTDRDYARFYASKFWLGDLYVVEPVGDVVASVEDPFPSFTCEGARILSIVSRAVRLTDRQRTTLTNKWKRRDEAARVLTWATRGPVGGTL